MARERLRHDGFVGHERFERVNEPHVVEGQQASALRFGDPRTMALFSALGVAALQPDGFSHRMLRIHIAPLLALPLDRCGPGKMTYDLRRLRLHGLIQRIPKTHRYTLTEQRCRLIVFLTKLYSHVIPPGCSDVLDTPTYNQDRQIAKVLRQFHQATKTLVTITHIAP